MEFNFSFLKFLFPSSCTLSLPDHLIHTLKQHVMYTNVQIKPVLPHIKGVSGRQFHG